VNRYCERLGIKVPRLEDSLAKRDARLFHLMVVVLLEHGQPMTLEQIVARLEAAGVRPGYGGTRSTDLVDSLKKAWHGMEPVYRDARGRYGVNLDSSELDLLLWQLRLRPGRHDSTLLPPPPPDPVAPPDTVPLSQEEVEAALEGRSSWAMGSLRPAAAVLEAFGSPKSIGDVRGILEELMPEGPPLSPVTVASWRATLITVDPRGRLQLNADSPDLPRLRQAIRRLSQPVLIRRLREAHWAARYAEIDRINEQEERKEELEAARLRRAVLRVVPARRNIQAASLLDVGTRTIKTMIGEELADLPTLLDAFDIVAGIAVRDALVSLGLDADRWRLVDLGPPQKTITINRRGRTLRLTEELVLRSTTGIGRPLGDPARIAAYLARGERGRLVRRLESDVKALHALYRFGVLHRSVRVRWGFLDEMIAVRDWAHPGDLSVHAVLRKAAELQAPVDIVTGSAPGWADPWARARRVRVTALLDRQRIALVTDGSTEYQIALDEIQDLRAAPPDASERRH
jgi:hypothetical protein